MHKVNKNLFQRAMAGAVLVSVILGSIYWSAWSFLIVFLIGTVLSVNEFHRITNNDEVNVLNWLAMVATALMFLFGFVRFAIHVPDFAAVIPNSDWLLNETIDEYLRDSYVFVCIVVFVAELYRKQKNPVSNMAYFVLGQVYVALPFTLLNGILFANGYEPIYLMALFISLWVNDTFAYLSGSLLGKHRLFERISPKKSWEGFIGGAIGVLLSGYIFSLILPELSLFQWFIFSEIVVICGTLGDLLESLLKRTIGVKDSGHTIPGHGGMLDRFDSMLLVAPVVYLYLNLVF